MKRLISGALLCAAVLTPAVARAQECILGEVRMFAGNFEPRPFVYADGRILSIAQNTALFSILGTMYGGNGQTTFALPDLRGRFPLGTGQGPGLTPRNVGEMAGEEQVTQTVAEMPIHTHTLMALSTPASHVRPQARVLAKVKPNEPMNIYAPGPPDVAMSPEAITPAGGSQPQQNMPPFLGMNYVICIEGIFPSRW
jgi:microcystin-dependent protein